MEDFVGTWDVEEKTFHGNRTLKDRPVQIKIVKNGTQYDVKIPLRGSKPVVFTESPYITPNGPTISHTWTSSKGEYEVRLVFNHKVNPAQIVERPGGSMIARWRPHVEQPDDMGTITGTRISPSGRWPDASR